MVQNYVIIALMLSVLNTLTVLNFCIGVDMNNYKKKFFHQRTKES